MPFSITSSKLLACLFFIPLFFLLPLGCESIGLGPHGEIPPQYFKIAKKISGAYEGILYQNSLMPINSQRLIGPNSFQLYFQDETLKIKWKRDPIGIRCATQVGNLEKVTGYNKDSRRAVLDFPLTSDNCKSKIYDPTLHITINEMDQTFWLSILLIKRPIHLGKQNRFQEVYIQGLFKKR